MQQAGSASDLPHRYPDLQGLLVIGKTVAVAEEIESLAAGRLARLGIGG